MISIVHGLLAILVGTLTAELAMGDDATLKSSVVKIVQYAATVEIGAGFIVKAEKDVVYILTASHVVGSANTVKVYFLDRPNSPVELDIRDIPRQPDQNTGLALIYITPTGLIPPGLRPLSIDATELTSEDNLVAIGHPRIGADWSMDRGNYAGPKGSGLTFTMPLSEGNSGGPVIRNGKVVALITEATKNPKAFGVPASALLQYLKGNQIQVADSSDNINISTAQNDDKCKLADPPITPCLFREKK